MSYPPPHQPYQGQQQQSYQGQQPHQGHRGHSYQQPQHAFQGAVTQQPLLPGTSAPQAQAGVRQPTSSNVGGRVANKAGAFGGSEIGSMVGRSVGPPIIGGIVGNIVGEKVGEKAVKESGLDRAAGQLNEDFGNLVGRKRADKVGEIAMTAMGYSEGEYCICCPCMPASQILFLVMMGFFVFNIYRLETGIEYEASCTRHQNLSEVITLPHTANQTDEYLAFVRNGTEGTTYLVSYPCHFGFHYLLSGAAVWIAFLPFYIFTLFGNCYRQCCCCLCDPVVCCTTIVDCIKRCCCECGSFSVTDFIWYSMCTFQVIWAVFGVSWLVETLADPFSDYKNYDTDGRLIPTVIAAVSLDLLLAGSELVHKIRLYLIGKQKKYESPNQIEMQEVQSR